jgi:hypothetical protein
MKPKRNLPSSLPAVFFFWGSAAVVVAPAFHCQACGTNTGGRYFLKE